MTTAFYNAHYFLIHNHHSQVLMCSVELNVNCVIQYDCWLGFPKNSFRNWRNIFATCHFSNDILSEVFTSVNVLIIDSKICQAAFNQCQSQTLSSEWVKFFLGEVLGSVFIFCILLSLRFLRHQTYSNSSCP